MIHTQQNIRVIGFKSRLEMDRQTDTTDRITYVDRDAAITRTGASSTIGYMGEMTS